MIPAWQRCLEVLESSQAYQQGSIKLKPNEPCSCGSLITVAVVQSRLCRPSSCARLRLDRLLGRISHGRIACGLGGRRHGCS